MKLISKILSTKQIFILITVLYRFILDLSYYNILNKYYAYSGLILDVDILKIIESYFLIIIVCIVLDNKIKKPSSFFIVYLFMMLYVPLTLIYSLQNQSRVFLYYVTFSFFLIHFIPLLKLPKFKIIFLKKGKRIAIVMSITISLLLFLWIIARGGLNYLNFNLLKVYDFRRTVGELVFPGKMAYVMAWYGKVINPTLLSYSLWKHNKKAIITTLLMQVLFFGITAHKSILFYPVIILFIYYYRDKRQLASMLPLGLFGITSLSYLIYVFSGEITMISLFVRRSILVAANNHYRYYNFFSESGLLYFSHKSWFPKIIDYPYSLPVPNLISLVTHGHADTYINTGFLATGYMNFGFFGMIAYSLIVGIVFRIINNLSEKRTPKWLSIAVMIIPVHSLLSSDLPTALLTSGIGLGILLLWLINSKE